MWRVCVAKKHMGPHIKAKSWSSFNATRLPHKTLPTQAFDWQLHSDGGTSSLSNIQQTHKHPYFSVFYLNGVKHLHKWGLAIHVLDKKVFFFPNLVLKKKKKKSWFYFLNSFCIFCEICSQTKTEVRNEASLPTKSQHTSPTQKNKTINPPPPRSAVNTP